METRRCKHCGADEALHHGDTLQCPDNGQASGDVGHNYWLNTNFEATMEITEKNHRQATAQLCNEAIQAYNETGLTPRQLLDQRDELIKAATEAIEYFGASVGVSGLREAIKKTKTK